MVINRPYMPVHWHQSNNFGDAITPYLVRKISGRIPIWTPADAEGEKFIVTGSSFMAADVKNAIVWGSGCLTSHDDITSKHTILAVRGKITGSMLTAKGVQYNQVYGDPTLLLPRIFDPPMTKQFKLGILPHYKDTKIIYDTLKMNNEELAIHGIKILDVLAGVEDVVCQIKSCEKIISSTLHGLMASHAYLVPCEWTKFSNNTEGDDVKYLDYFSSINCSKLNYIDLRTQLNINILTALINQMEFNLPIMDNDLNRLFNCCPFRY